MDGGCTDAFGLYVGRDGKRSCGGVGVSIDSFAARGITAGIGGSLRSFLGMIGTGGSFISYSPRRMGVLPRLWLGGR